MQNKSNLRSAISLAGTGKKVPALDLVRKDPAVAAIVSKLISPRDQAQYDDKGNRTFTNPDTFSFRNLSDRSANNIRDAEIIMQLLPDMELWSQILISSILSPKDMMSTEVNLTPPADLLPSEVSNALIQKLKTYFEQVYKIKPLLPEILRDVLFKTGSYPVAVIPENSLDELINGAPKITLENLKNHIGDKGEIQPLGILGPRVKEHKAQRSVTGISFESFSYDAKRDKPAFEGTMVVLDPKSAAKESYIYVSDNPDLLKVPQINERIRAQQINNALGMRAMESISKMTDRQVAGLLYKNKQPTYKHLVSIKTDNQAYRRSVGEPLIIKISSEAVIPVHIPGAPEKQIGYFILIDGEGNPLSRNSVEDQYRMLGNRLSNGMTQNFPSAMVDKVNNMMGTGNEFNPNNRTHIDYGVRAYSELIEADLLARLRNGIYGSGVAISNNQEVYRIMMARALQKQNTQLLFIPAELMTYFALKYDNEGIGRSLIDDMKILLSLRVMLMFANVMASIKNSIGRTEVKIKLDENDPDPKKTIETTINEIIRTRMSAFPIGMSSPTDTVDWLQRAGFEFTFEGHPGLPDVAVDFGEKSTQYTKPDTDLEEQLRKNSIMAAGLNPETVDAGFAAEFATSVVANNILLSKRVIQIQEKLTPLLGDHMRKIAIASQPLADGLRAIIRENLAKVKERLTDEFAKENDHVIVEQVFQDFIYGVEVSLPAPNSVTLENQKEALEKYTESLDAILDSYISDKLLTDATAGNISGDVSVIREVVKAYFIRKWVAENGMLPEISSLTATGEDGAPMINFFNEQKSHIEALTKSLANLMVQLKENTDRINKVVEDTGLESQGVEGSTSDTSSSSGGSDDGLGDDFGGGFDFGGGDGLDSDLEEIPPSDEEKKTDENSTPNETPSETPSETPNQLPE